MALYKDFKAQSQIALEKFILLKMKECFKENKALKAQLNSIKKELKQEKSDPGDRFKMKGQTMTKQLNEKNEQQQAK